MNIVSLPTEGEQPYDMATEFDPLRYGGWAGDAYTAAKVTETYSHNNSVTYPQLTSGVRFNVALLRRCLSQPVVASRWSSCLS